jgi:Xaa-Pro aminopeptidase
MITLKEYRSRRKLLMATAGRGSAIIIPSAPERIRNNDAHYPYRQDSDFLYLTGFSEPESVMVLVPGRPAAEVILFCRETDATRERWDGPRVGTENASSVLGVDDAFPIDDIDEILPGLIEGRDRVYYHFGRDAEFDLRVLGWINRLRAQVKMGARPPQSLVALGHLLHEQRLFKSPAELKLMRTSAAIAVEAHTTVAKVLRPGMTEFAVEAEILKVLRSRSAVSAYETIVGGGNNACILHYRENRAVLRGGDLLLVDAGAEYQGYASDITRTIPINGVFSPIQRALYDIVLRAQLAAIDCVRPGKLWSDIHEAAVRVITHGLLQLGLLKGTLAHNINKEKYKKFFMHKTGHWLGLDVHDVGDYKIAGESRCLEPGMVLTVEPGIYIPLELKSVPQKFRGIGIRIEDDILVTSGEPEVLTAAACKDPDEIEALMAQHSTALAKAS